MYSTDSYFHIGASHLLGGKPCQDYALDSNQDGLALAIVADGCSTGGMTDVGARLLAHSVKSAIKSIVPIYSPEINYRDTTILRDIHVNSAMRNLGLSVRDMQSTCSYVAVHDGKWLCQIYGDGIIVEKYTDGIVFMTQVQWDKNLPYYPIYTGNVLEEFKMAHDKETPFTWETWVFDPESDAEKYLTEDAGLGVERAIREGYRLSHGSDDELESIAVFTDGVAQIEGIDWKDVVMSLMSFKTTEGSFLKRRMISELKKLAKAGHKNIDDIAGAVVRYEG